MAQTNFTPILTYKSDTASAVPSAGNLTNSANGAELAVNTADKRLFTKDSGNNVVELGTSPSSLTLPNGTANGVVYANGSKVLTTGSALTFNGTQLGVGTTSFDGNWTPAFQVVSSASDGTGGIMIESYRPSLIFKDDSASAVRQHIVADGSALIFGSGDASFTEKARIDSSGNLGLGVTPSAWQSGTKAIETVGGSMWAYNANELDIYQNGYFNGTSNIYKTSAAASRYEQNTGVHKWYNAPSGTAGNAITFTQAMTLDASGYLFVGATSSAGVGAKRLQVGSTASATTQILTQSTTTHLGLYASSSTGAYLSYAVGSELILGNGPADGSTFTERARIDSSGNLLVGTTSAFAVSKVTFRGSGNTLTCWDSGGASSAALICRIDATNQRLTTYNYNGSDVGTVTTNGTITIYGTTSDYRLKTIVGSISDSGSRIDALEPVEYEWKADGSRTRGFLAHKFQEVYAGSVSGTKDAVDAEGNPVYQSMQASSSEVIADLVAEIQSLRQRVASLEA